MDVQHNIKTAKNFINLCHREDDFGMPAEWHFFATSHGKGPCDGVGGTVKRLAAHASLQRPYDKHILTPHQLYDFSAPKYQQVTFTTQQLQNMNMKPHCSMKDLNPVEPLRVLTDCTLFG